jgi:hypothetical protein
VLADDHNFSKLPHQSPSKWSHPAVVEDITRQSN